MPIRPTLLLPFVISTPHYQLEITQQKHKTLLSMQLFGQIVNTTQIPKTYDFLHKFLPAILRAQCFNDDKLPFKKEVCHTEIGHLFEHILLEYLCIEKLALGFNRASYQGVTHWNWKKDPRGTFHIIIDSGSGDAAFFPKALQKTMQLMELILDSQKELTIKPFVLPLLTEQTPKASLIQ
jgi:hypothetical protein